MGAGIQQPTQQQASVSTALGDVIKVLYEPSAVFGRIGGWASIVMPFLAMIAVQIALFFVNMPFMKVAIQAQMAARGAPAGATPPMGVIIAISLVSLVVMFAVVLLVSGTLLWVLASVMGGEAKFSRLLSVAAYGFVPAGILLGIIGTIVLHMKGATGITSPQDMQPALGLDLLAPGTKGFVGALLKGINPLSIWGMVITAIGVYTTQRMSKSNGYTVAAIQFGVLLLVISGLAGMFNR
jgi:hypothetical protein